jgi:hypothetical protein
MSVIIIYTLLIHTIVSFTAARWWLRPVLLGFDRKYKLPPCRESDFYFFCWTWSIVLVLIALYAVWRSVADRLIRPLYRATIPAKQRMRHEAGTRIEGPIV